MHPTQPKRAVRSDELMFKNFLKSFQPQSAAAAKQSKDEPEALIAAGNAAEDAGRLQEAHALYLRAIALAPSFPEGHLNLGIVQEAMGQAQAARTSYERVLALVPGHPFGAYNLAKLDYVEGRFKTAEALLRQALAGKPEFPQAWVMLSNVLDSQGNAQGAADAIEQALLLKPGFAGALHNQADVLRKLGRIDEATEAAARAAELDPETDRLASLARLQYVQGFVPKALSTLKRAISQAPDRLDLISVELFFSNLVDEQTPESLFNRHRAWGAALEAQIAPLQLPPRQSSGRLRLGFVSQDYGEHPVSLFLIPVLERLSRDRFEIFCYSSTSQKDHMTQRIESICDHWVDATRWKDEQLATAIAQDRIDILVDLGGHTGSVRLGVFAAKPAPVQVSWIGYLNTSGLSRIGWRITDARCDPPEQSQRLHTEQLLVMPHSQWCYRPFIPVAPAPAAPCERNGFVTFASLNSLHKLTDSMVACIGRMLKSIPTARLLIADVSSVRKREAILTAIEEAGVTRERVEFTPRVKLEAYFRMMDRVDIAIDTHPYGGGTTTFDALWMGVPVLTATGSVPASRSAASLLSALDLQHWIAPSLDRLAELGVQRAADLGEIAALRRSLRERLRCSPLMDEANFVAAFESLLMQAWNAEQQQIELSQG